MAWQAASTSSAQELYTLAGKTPKYSIIAAKMAE
jgi:hypothetical protein